VTEREKILGRIREALTVQAPVPGHHAPSPSPAARPLGARAGEWLPSVGQTFDECVARFRANAADLKAGFHLLAHRNELTSQMLLLRDGEKWKKIASHAGDLTDFVCGTLSLPIVRTDKHYDVTELESCDVGITECDALVAQTGSVLLTNRSAGGRALSILPAHHVVLARRDQLVRDLPAAFQFLKKKYGANYPSMISFITGPSRTGDIERILVLGAHGPKKLTIFVC
jgi:L-lactate dehydrogenase complex protein LldG